MSKAVNSLQNINLLDDLSRKDTSIHKLHPLAKLITTVVYLTVVISFDRYEISGILPYVFYPVIIISLAELPIMPILKRVLIVEPLIIGIGILNPLFDHHAVMVGSMVISRGWITFASIFIKCGLTVIVSILLVSTTGMIKLSEALRMLKVPKIFVLQLLLTYRYISVLLEEVSRMLIAYSLRAPNQKGVSRKALGSFVGQLLLRTMDRAQRVYQSMNLRGFNGDYNSCHDYEMRVNDIAYIIVWSMLFIIARFYDVPILIGSIFTGVIK